MVPGITVIILLICLNRRPILETHDIPFAHSYEFYFNPCSGIQHFAYCIIRGNNLSSGICYFFLLR